MSEVKTVEHYLVARVMELEDEVAYLKEKLERRFPEADACVLDVGRKRMFEESCHVFWGRSVAFDDGGNPVSFDEFCERFVYRVPDAMSKRVFVEYFRSQLMQAYELRIEED